MQLRLGLPLQLQRSTDGRALYGVGCLGHPKWPVWRDFLRQHSVWPVLQIPGACRARWPGTACAYVDIRVSKEQRQALERIGTGKAGGGIFELFGAQLVTTWLPTKEAPIDFEISEGIGRVCIDGFGEAESELLSYPDGTVIRPSEELPHGIEFKRGLMTNAKRWHWQDRDLLASYANKYGAVAKVKFTEVGCVG